MSEFQYEGIRFHYIETGAGEPLIFLHGLGGSIAQPQILLDPIDGVRFIFLDQRGHGGTPLGDPACLTFENMAKDVVALANHLNLKSFGLGGISMGAAVAVSTVLRYPERVSRLILCRISFGERPMDDKHCAWHSLQCEYLKKGDRQAFLESKLFADITSEHPDTANIFLAAFSDPASLEYPEKFALIPPQRPFGSFSRLDEIKCPTLICSDRQCPIHKYSLGVEYSKHIHGAVFIEVSPKSAVPKQYRDDVNTAIRSHYKGGEL